MQEKGVQEFIVGESLPPSQETSKLISNCRAAGMEVHLVPPRYELYLSKARLTEIDDVPLLSLEEQSLPVLGLKVRRIMDLLIASLLLLLTGPLLILSAGALYVSKQQTFCEKLRSVT